MQVLLQTRWLQVAHNLLHAPPLVKELENFKVEVTAARDEAEEVWREGQRDDLALAVPLIA